MSFFEPPVRERLNACSNGHERNRHFFRYFNVRRFRGKSDEVAVVLNRQGVIGDRKRRILLDCLPEFTGGHGLYLRSATDRSEPRGPGARSNAAWRIQPEISQLRYSVRTP